VIDGGAQGIILDLRRNPGGGLEATVQTADLFLEDGEIITEVSREGDRRTTSAQPGGVATDIPVVVLVGPGSASGSEVLAARAPSTTCASSPTTAPST
jgi:carboxyl-terminal processing protease